MKTRLLWTLILTVGGMALYFGIARPHVSSIPSEIREPLDELKPVLPSLEPPELIIPEIQIPPLTLPPIQPAARSDPIPGPPEVPIQNEATIDFSTGAPVVKTHGKDQEELERALKEISDVLQDTTIKAKR